jgi:DNA-binding beta-propeller fold protein YncE
MKRACVGLLACIAAACGSDPEPSKPLRSPEDFLVDITDAPSCALSCDPVCAERDKPWICPALGKWSDIPHAAECGTFDGKTFPEPKKGACVATDPAGEALAKTTSTGKPVVLPDGRRFDVGDRIFADYPGGFPVGAMHVRGTKLYVVSDNGYDVQSLRVVTSQGWPSNDAFIASSVRFDPPKALSLGLAYLETPSLLYAPSGLSDARILAFDLDRATGKLTANAAKNVQLPNGTLPQGLAVSPDGRTMLAGSAKDARIFVISLEAATYGQVTGTITAPQPDVFAVKFDPHDATGNTAYATLWRGPDAIADPNKMLLVQLDVANRRATRIVVGKAPEDFVFLDARYMVVANALSDTLSIVDRPASKVVADVALTKTNGLEPTWLAWDEARKRLYATLASNNGVAVFDVDTTPTPPTLTPAGVIPTAWWPTSVSVDPADGEIMITSGKGHGLGTDKKPKGINQGFSTDAMQGSMQVLARPDATQLAALTAQHKAATEVQKIAGYPTIDCKGQPYDFPLPQKPEDGASKQIKYVFFIVRENKTYDALFGDLPGGADGDPALVMAPGKMEQIWPNARAIAQQFSHMDNFYEDAEQSIQGHVWTVFGRTTDYDERRWLQIWGRGQFSATASPGVGEDTSPLEGSIFTTLKAAGISIDNGGELIGGIAFRDLRWPGGSSESTKPDTLSACYIAARMRVLCNPKQFTYSWLGNDHGFGLAAGKPNPAIMVAVNDEATGMYLDGISHSPFWPESLVIVVEDDPQDGGDHVDQHRTIALFASPWIKRKYVSKGHYDMASIHKIFAHVYGKPYRNEIIANAPMPFDLFTSTPDYAPFDYLPRRHADISCNPGGTAGAKAAERWDFTDPDDQPGLNLQNWEYFRSISTSR